MASYLIDGGKCLNRKKQEHYTSTNLKIGEYSFRPKFWRLGMQKFEEKYTHKLRVFQVGGVFPWFSVFWGTLAAGRP